MISSRSEACPLLRALTSALPAVAPCPHSTTTSPCERCNPARTALQLHLCFISMDRRHATSSARARENVAIPHTGPFLVKRKKSRDRNRMISDDETPVIASDMVAKKKRHHTAVASATPGPSNANRVRTMAYVDAGDPSRPHHSKAKTRHAPRQPSETHTNTLSTANHMVARIKKELGHKRRPPREVPVSAMSDEEDDVGGPVASVEFMRLKKEIEHLRKEIASSAKTAEKHSQTIKDLKETLSTKSKSNKEQRHEIEKLKAKAQQSDTVISGIEGTLQCQICIDTLKKPYGLSPCGHVLCQGCLQEWFKAAPVAEAMDVDAEPRPLVSRKKSCPVCRTIVRQRPLPLFLVKSLVSILDKAKAGPGAARPSPPPDTDDPWMDIFPVMSDTDEDDEDDDYDVYEDDSGMEGGFRFASDEDEEGIAAYYNTTDEEYEGEWVAAQWEPPAYRRSTPLVDDDEYLDRILRRGPTPMMVDTFEMEYTHRHGLTAEAAGLTIYLGWNIELGEDDLDGERFIAWCLEDMDSRTDRWVFDEGNASRLVREDAVGEYDSDAFTDVWIGDDGDDEEEDEDDEDDE
ncbi:hypothetical protein FA95DRAFT_1539323 [Auriscalpium vulgare]|uniref:Uncharacterized protein n=1 Tax=Auriscalpium vulgare TaxID=40419 RepID=A0ACB8RYT0_9AGAM|nr:hypothetical protein FA95DRAFT_1539323 [Auriscalpium vulgare]